MEGLRLENCDLTLTAPRAEINGDVRELGADLTRLEKDARPQITRFRYRLGGQGGKLTKKNGKDNFVYTSFSVPAGSRFTEIQLNQYSRTRHAWLPQFITHDEARYRDRFTAAGPILLIEKEGETILAAYEHGGEHADDFLHFTVTRSPSGYEVSLECGNGTYCGNTIFNEESPYFTVWFDIGVISGAKEDALKAMRNFLLHDFGPSESRHPYIFYNTWNNQERNRALRGRKYLADMNTTEMLKDIDIAHKIGIDVFVLDSGWYKGTGDWEVAQDRFPDGLAEIRKRLDSYGMKLGLWFNPAAAALSSRVANEHPEWRKEKNGKPVNIGPVWETEESWGMCLVSDYADWFIDKLVEIGERLGVRYFKWDAVDLRGCDSAYHHHGGEDCSPEERERNFRFECVRSLTHIASEVSRRLPGAIVDLDITERGRAVGLGFLAGGKFFAMNNGPYYLDFDIPDAANSHRDNWNVFFWPGTARNEVCRQPLAFDAIVPSVLNLTHFLPDGPSGARQNALVSLYLGGNGIWGDLGSLDADGIAELAEGVSSYKAVASDLTEAYPITRGFIGASPEVHEKLNPATGRGIVAFFTREPLDAEWLTQPLAGSPKIKGADEVQKMSDGRYLLRLHLGKDEARAVFFA